MSYSVRPQRRQPTRLPRPWDSPGKNTGVGCHFLLQCMKVKSEREVTQSCPTLAIPWNAAYQAPPSMGFSRQKYWSGVPLPSPRQRYHIQMTGSSVISWLPPPQVLQTQGMDNNCPCLFPLQLSCCNHPGRWLISRIWRLRAWSHSPPGGQDSASILVGSEVAMTILMIWVYLEN